MGSSYLSFGWGCLRFQRGRKSLCYSTCYSSAPSSASPCTPAAECIMRINDHQKSRQEQGLATLQIQIKSPEVLKGQPLAQAMSAAYTIYIFQCTAHHLKSNEQSAPRNVLQLDRSGCSNFLTQLLTLSLPPQPPSIAIMQFSILNGHSNVLPASVLPTN